MWKQGLAVIVSLFMIANAASASAPGNSISMALSYPKYPDAPGIVECRFYCTQDENSIVTEVAVALYRVKMVNGQRKETLEHRGVVQGAGAETAVFEFRIEESGTFCFKYAMRTKDTVTGKANPDIVKTSADKTVTFSP